MYTIFILQRNFYYMTEDSQSILAYLRDSKGSFTWWFMAMHQPGQCISLTTRGLLSSSLYKSITVCELHSCPCVNCTWSNYVQLGTNEWPKVQTVCIQRCSSVPSHM